MTANVEQLLDGDALDALIAATEGDAATPATTTQPADDPNAEAAAEYKAPAKTAEIISTRHPEALEIRLALSPSKAALFEARVGLYSSVLNDLAAGKPGAVVAVLRAFRAEIEMPGMMKCGYCGREN